jgi:L-lactate dehydrogenase complex protein LldE
MATLSQSLSRQTSLQDFRPQDLKIGLFMPCYVDLVHPKVGIATLQLLETFGLDVDYPLNQACCGQPMSNSGDQLNARGDIEATLVHGAQGARSLNLFVANCLHDPAHLHCVARRNFLERDCQLICGDSG